MITREAIILAGGMGSRLKSVVADRPKPMAEINGRPFLEYLLDYLIGQGITRIILSVGYKHDVIQTHFKGEYRNVPLIYAVEEQPLGTGGGIRNALRYTLSEEAFMINGDTYFPVSLDEMSRVFTGTRADLVMALHPVEESDRYGTIETDENGRIIAFREKSSHRATALINGGIYLMKKELLLNRFFPESFSFETGFLEKYTNALYFAGIIFENGFIDIGIPESYRHAQFILKDAQYEK